MAGLEKLLRLAADMESFAHRDKLAEVVSRASGEGSGELSEDDLELVSAAGEQTYQKFLRRLDRKDED